MFGSDIENLVYYYLPLGGLWKVVMLSHACRQLKIQYHIHNRVAINWPTLIIYSNNWIQWYRIVLLSHAGRELKIHYHRHNRVAVNWPALIICSNNCLRGCNIVLLSHADRELKIHYHRHNRFAVNWPALLFAQIIASGDTTLSCCPRLTENWKYITIGTTELQ